MGQAYRKFDVALLVPFSHETQFIPGYYFCPSRYPAPESMYEYDLFAVINHEGQIDNGHYTSFARFQDEASLASALFLGNINRD